jgi:hypothetical protein
MLISPSPFYLDDYKMTGNFIYNWFSVILFKVLYFDITSTLLYTIILYSIVWDVQYGVYVKISAFWQGQEVWSSDIYKQSLI